MGYRKIINRQDYSPKRVIGKSKHRLLLQPKTRPKKNWQRFVLSDTEFREERVLKPLHPPDRLEPATLSVAQKRSGRTTTLLWAERSRYSGCQPSQLYIYIYIYIHITKNLTESKFWNLLPYKDKFDKPLTRLSKFNFVTWTQSTLT